MQKILQTNSYKSVTRNYFKTFESTHTKTKSTLYNPFKDANTKMINNCTTNYVIWQVKDILKGVVSR